MRQVGIVAILLLLVLASCGPQAKVTKLGDKEIKTTKFRAPEPETKTSDKIQEQFAPTPLSQWQIIVFNISNTHNYAFSVNHGIQGGARFKFFNELGRLDYNSPKSLAAGNIIDIVYFNTERKRASGFCRTHDRPCEPFAGDRRTLTYQEFYYPTPKDWVMKFQNVAPSEFVEEAQIISDNFANKVVFDNPRIKTTLYIDQFTKLPIRVIEEAEGGAKSRFDYDGLEIGTVTAKDVFH